MRRFLTAYKVFAPPTQHSIRFIFDTFHKSIFFLKLIIQFIIANENNIPRSSMSAIKKKYSSLERKEGGGGAEVYRRQTGGIKMIIIFYMLTNNQVMRVLSLFLA